MSEPLHTAVPAEIGRKHLDINMPGGAATLDDLLVILESQGLSVSYSWESAGNADDIGARRLPFRNFQGTVSELLARLQMGMSIASWWNTNTLYLAPLQRYTVKVPQNDEVIGVVEGQLESLGAQDIVSSLYAGQVTYSASPESNAELIAPFLRRLALNMSEITLQVALVRVSMDEAARRGFDWSSFNLAYAKNISTLGTTSSTSSSSNSTGTATTTSTTGTGTTTGTSSGGTTTALTNAAQYGIGSIIGGSGGSSSTTSTGVATEGSSGVEGLLASVPGLVAQASVGRLSLTAAIGLLSEFGTTSTDQNVELRTLAGQPVHLRDGGETPYVSQITSNTTISGSGAGNASNSVEFETVDTGLTLDLTPNFDAGSGIVTVDVSMNVEDIESFLALPSGTSYGDIERPVTSNRELTDLVRVAAGETVILGGVTKISKSDDRSAPLEFWTIGSDNSETDRVALFIILRPFVTVYELDGNVMGEEPRETVATAPPAMVARPAPAPAKPAAHIVQQSLTGSGRPVTGNAPIQAPIPGRNPLHRHRRTCRRPPAPNRRSRRRPVRWSRRLRRFPCRCVRRPSPLRVRYRLLFPPQTFPPPPRPLRPPRPRPVAGHRCISTISSARYSCRRRSSSRLKWPRQNVPIQRSTTARFLSGRHRLPGRHAAQERCDLLRARLHRPSFRQQDRFGLLRHALRRGYIFEAHEGGAQRAYLPNLLKAIEEDPTSSACIQMARRILEVKRAASGTYTSILLPEGTDSQNPAKAFRSPVRN